MGLKSSLLWESAKGRGMIRVNEGATTAAVLVGDCTASELRELARYAEEAATQLEGFAAEQRC